MRVPRSVWDGDRNGGSWPVAALGAGASALAGAGFGGFGPPGVGFTLLSEAVVGVAVALSGVAVVGWRRARADRPDVDLPRGPAPRVAVELVGLGRSWPEVESEALAEVRHSDLVQARLYRLTRTGVDTQPVVVAHRPDADEPQEPMSGTSRRERRTRRLQLKEDGGSAQRPGRVLMLEHRLGTEDDLDPGDDPETDPSLVPAVVVRLFDVDQGRAVAGAHVYRQGDLDYWVVPAAQHTLRLRAARSHQPMPRGRSTRRTFIDAAGAGYVLRSRRRPRRWEFTAPLTLDSDAVLLCVWLVHLLDVHVLLGRSWEPEGLSWRPVEENFPVRVGPGGFGDAHLPPTHSQGGGGGS